MKVKSSGYTGLGFSGQHLFKISSERMQEYRESLGPCPEYARIDTVGEAIAATTLMMQLTDDLENYEQCVRNVRQLRGIYDLLKHQSAAVA